MIEHEKEFERFVPMQSILGRAYLGLQAERNKRKQEFESDPNKMACDTLPYRRAEIALCRFMDEWTERVKKAEGVLAPAMERMTKQEAKAQDNSTGHGIAIDRHDEKIIWTRFAVERYRELAKPFKRTFKTYHPSLWRDLNKKWREFRVQIRKWKYGGQPFNGSQAMSAMIDFQVQCLLLASHND